MVGWLRMLVVVAGLGALLVTGCGDSGSDASSGPEITTSSLSKAKFVEQANLACSREKERLLGRVAAYRPPAGSQQESAQEQLATKLAAVIIPTVEGEIAAIQALGAPKGEEESVAAILAAQQKGIEEVSRLTAVRSVRDIAARFGEATKLAEKYGLTSCTVTPEPNPPEAGS